MNKYYLNWQWSEGWGPGDSWLPRQSMWKGALYRTRGCLNLRIGGKSCFPKPSKLVSEAKF